MIRTPSFSGCPSAVPKQCSHGNRWMQSCLCIVCFVVINQLDIDVCTGSFGTVGCQDAGTTYNGMGICREQPVNTFSSHGSAAPRPAKVAQDAGIMYNGTGIRIAFIGNSFIYYNDLPHMVQHLLSEGRHSKRYTQFVHVGACLRGGASLTALLAHGANMKNEVFIGGRDMFRTVDELLAVSLGWDVVVFQDHSQIPARAAHRQETMGTLQEKYLPMLVSMPNPPLVVLYQTWGYISPTKGSEKIGNFSSMTKKLINGYADYAALFERGGLSVATVSAGVAFATVQRRVPALWPKLYQSDKYHPSGLGSFLVATHIATTIAESPRLSQCFRDGCHVSPYWPDDIAPSFGIPPPSFEDTATILSVAGPRMLYSSSAKVPNRTSLVVRRLNVLAGDWFYRTQPQQPP